MSDVAIEAVSILCNEGRKFKLVMAKANMPGMNIIHFLDLLLRKDILLVCKYQFKFLDSFTKISQNKKYWYL